MQSFCIASNDTGLLVRLIDWLNSQPENKERTTTIFVCEGNVIERFGLSDHLDKVLNMTDIELAS